MRNPHGSGTAVSPPPIWRYNTLISTIKTGPKLATATPIEAEEVIEQLIAATNQTRGSVLAVLSELDEVILLTGLAYALSNTSRTLEASVLRVKGLDKKSISAVSTPWRTTSLSM